MPLSSGEFRLLSALLERPGMVLSRDQLLDLTRGRSAQPFDRSIDNQVSRLRKKIERDPRNPRADQDRLGRRLQLCGRGDAAMRLAPKSLAGRLAAMLVLTLLVAQMVSFGLFAGERVVRLLSKLSRGDDRPARDALVDLLEETPADLQRPRARHDELGASFASAIAPEPSLEASAAGTGELRSRIATALGKPPEAVRVSAWSKHWHCRHRWETRTRTDRTTRMRKRTRLTAAGRPGWTCRCAWTTAAG